MSALNGTGVKMLKLGRLAVEWRPVAIERPNPNRVSEADPETIEVVLQGYAFGPAPASVKNTLAALRLAYQKATRPLDDEGRPIMARANGADTFRPDQPAWERYMAGSLKALVPDMTEEEAAFLAAWGANSEKALDVLYYLDYWNTPGGVAIEVARTAEAATRPEA